MAERRRSPAEDILSALIAAEEAGDRLSTDELYATLILLFLAGHETTANLIGNGALALLRQPAQLRRLLEHPALIGSDPAHFAEPDRLDVTRQDNRHLAFGTGIHFCLGAPLARLEGRIAFAALLRRCPGLALATDRIEWRQTFALRALVSLPVRFSPGS